MYWTISGGARADEDTTPMYNTKANLVEMAKKPEQPVNEGPSVWHEVTDFMVTTGAGESLGKMTITRGAFSLPYLQASPDA